MNVIKNLKIKRIVKKIDKNIKVKFGKRLECSPEDNTIYIAYKTNEIDKKTFMDFVKELNPQCSYDDITLGILHEIGHCMTYDEEMEEDYTLCVNVLSELYRNEKINETQFNEFYVRLDLEKKATEWAVDFARNNPKITDKLAIAVGVM